MLCIASEEIPWQRKGNPMHSSSSFSPISSTRYSFLNPYKSLFVFILDFLFLFPPILYSEYGVPFWCSFMSLFSLWAWRIKLQVFVFMKSDDLGIWFFCHLIGGLYHYLWIVRIAFALQWYSCFKVKYGLVLHTVL